MTSTQIHLNPEPLWLLIARAELGTKEIPGPGSNSRILDYQRSTKLARFNEEIPWCAAFICWCLAQAGYPHTNSAAARSFEKYGDKVLVPQPGDIVVLTRAGTQTGSFKKGHVGFFVREDQDGIWILGGNQKNEVCIRAYAKRRLIGYRRPRPIFAAPTLTQATVSGSA